METKIYIENLEVFAYHGLFEEENKLGQKFIFDIICDVDYTKALVTDDMNDSVSYADIAQVVVNTATNNTFNLLERLAGEIVKQVFNNFSSINNINLKINKPNAPVRLPFTSCGVELQISRKEAEDIL